MRPYVVSIYLFFKFQIEIIRTYIYLIKSGFINKNHLIIPLDSKQKINFPDYKAHIANPSIINLDNKIFGVARISNATYEIFADFAGRPIQLYRKRELPHVSGVISFQTNTLGEVFNLFEIHNLSEIPNYEDPRVFLYKDKKFLAMTYNTNPKPYTKERWKCTMAIENLESGEIFKLTSPLGKGIEKNWTPIEGFEKITLLYSSNPISILEIDWENKLTKLITKNQESPIQLNNRTQMIRTPHPLIPLLRIGSKKFAHRKYGYTPFHYFEIFSNKLDLLHTSKPFVFSSVRMEICHGILIQKENLVLSWTEDERTNMIGSIQLDAILKLFDSVLHK